MLFTSSTWPFLFFYGRGAFTRWFLLKTVLPVSDALMHGKLAGQHTNSLETIAAWTNGTYMLLLLKNLNLSQMMSKWSHIPGDHVKNIQVNIQQTTREGYLSQLSKEGSNKRDGHHIFSTAEPAAKSGEMAE